MDMTELTRGRFELWHSPTGITLINDACSSDLTSVQCALEQLCQVKRKESRGVFILNGMTVPGGFDRDVCREIGELAAVSGVDLLILVGGENPDVTKEAFLSKSPDGKVLRYGNADEVSGSLRFHLRTGDTVLLNGTDCSSIDRAACGITDAMAYNRFFVDVRALSENVSRFRRRVGPKTRILGMVKAIAYGCDLVKLSRKLETLGLDVLGVSTPDEGMMLRKAGIELPILVTFCTQDEVDKVAEYSLITALYSFDMIAPLAEAARKSGKRLPVHLKVDTGMGRLGVMPEEVAELAKQVSAAGSLEITGLMTHLGYADDPAEDAVTYRQIERFRQAVSDMHALGFTDIISHAAATSGTVRFPESHFDMVRIGLGFYGMYPSQAVADEMDLELPIAFVSRIAEIRAHCAGNRIGYNGTFTVPSDGFRVGIIPCGYHDGLPRNMSNNGYVLVNGRRAPIIGRISMDSAVIDLNDIPDACIGSDVLIYGKHDGYTLRPEEVAAWSGTIAYELVVRLGSRVQRIYLE